MTYRKISGLKHLSSLPSKSGGTVKVYVRKANKQLLEYWNQAVQPLIDNAEENRADKGWSWPTLTKALTFVANILRQKPCCYTVGIEYNQKFFPCALIFLAENYNYLKDRNKTGSFIWFMASAPDEFYHQHGLGNQIPKLGFACLDIGVTSSFNNSNDGLMGLHASPSGGQRLLDFYLKHRMHRLGKAENISIARQNDGRYFYFDEIEALKFSQQYDQYR